MARLPPEPLAEPLAELLPDIMQEHILSRLSVQELLRLCASSRRLSGLCQDEALWQRVAARDYPGFYPVPPGSWFTLVKELASAKIVVVVYSSPIETNPTYSKELILLRSTTVHDFALLLLTLPYVFPRLPSRFTATQANSLAQQLNLAPEILPSTPPDPPNIVNFSYLPGTAAATVTIVSGILFKGFLQFTLTSNGWIGIGINPTHRYVYYPPATLLTSIPLATWLVELMALYTLPELARLPSKSLSLYDLITQINILIG